MSNLLADNNLDSELRVWLLAVNSIRTWAPVDIKIVEHVLFKGDNAPRLICEECDLYVGVRSREPIELTISQECRNIWFCHYPNEQKVDEAISECIQAAFQTVGQRDIEVIIVRYAKPDTERVEACIAVRVPKKRLS